MAEAVKIAGKKAQITLQDDSIIVLQADDIKEVARNMGDVRLRHEICGINPFLGPLFCPKCKAKGDGSHCGKYFVYSSARGEPGPIEIQLKDGRMFYAIDFKLIEENVC